MAPNICVPERRISARVKKSNTMKMCWKNAWNFTLALALIHAPVITAASATATITFDEEGKGFPSIRGEHVVFKGTCNVENGVISFSGAQIPQTLCRNGKWETPPVPLSAFSDGEVNIEAQVRPGQNTPTPIATATLSLHIVNLLKEGAKGDGSTDDSAAITAALAKARQRPHGVVYAPPGHTYVHSGTLKIVDTEIFGGGDQTVFHATNPLKSAIYLTGEKPRLRNLKLTTNLEGIKRQTTPDTARVVAMDANAFTIDRVNIDGAASSGIFIFGGFGAAARPCNILNNQVANTLADGIHITRRSRFIRVEGNEVYDAGDDLIAVVSYVENREIASDVLIQDNKVARQKAGRGITVVGGRNVYIRNNLVQETYGSGIYVASEGSWNTMGAENVVIEGNQVLNTGSSNTMASILLTGRSEYPVKNVRIHANKIIGTHRDAIGVRSHVSDVTVTGNRIGTVGDAGVRLAGARDIVIEANTLQSISRSGLLIESSSSGSLKILSNSFLEINTKNEPGHAVILIPGNPNLGPVEIQRNKFDDGKFRGAEFMKVQVKADARGNSKGSVKGFLTNP